MNPVITEHQAEIAEVCRRHKILRLEAYELLGRIGPPEAPYELGFVADFAQIESRHYRQVVNLEEDLGKVLNRRVWISGLSGLKIEARGESPNPEALRILKEMEPVYGNGKSTATSRSTGSAAAA